MAKYYAAVAGLPNITVEDRKIPFSTKLFLEDLQQLFGSRDRELLSLLVLEEQNVFLLRYFEDANKAKGNADSQPSRFSYSQIDDLAAAFREETKLPNFKNIPAYFYPFIREQLGLVNEDESDEPINPNAQSAEDRLAAYYFAQAMKSSNRFISDWFALNLNIRNILAAHTCHKLGWSSARYVVGDGEIQNKLRTSNARDFGLGDELPYLQDILRIGEESDITRRERQLDLVKWEWLENSVFNKTFDTERLLAYLLQLQIVERWADLNEKTGEETFRNIVKTLKQESTDSLEEFKRNQKK